MLTCRRGESFRVNDLRQAPGGFSLEGGIGRKAVFRRLTFGSPLHTAHYAALMRRMQAGSVLILLFMDLNSNTKLIAIHKQPDDNIMHSF